MFVWTGREAIAWGGCCCGDSLAGGFAFSPASGRWRTLPKAPLPGMAVPNGTWTGTELVIAGGGNERGHRASAAYNPRTNRWRRIAPVPESLGWGAITVWTGREVLVVGGSGAHPATLTTRGFAYDPVTDRWRRLAAPPAVRVHATWVWTGQRLLGWGGQTRVSGDFRYARKGLSYDPATDRWSTFPPAPIAPRTSPLSVWTGDRMIVWGGRAGGRWRDTGAAFTPAP